MPEQYLINSLALQYPSISNQEAEWLKEDADVVELMKKSRLYMIGQRQELLFDDPVFNQLTGKIEIAFRSHTGEVCQGEIDLRMQEIIGALMKDRLVNIEAGPKMVRIFTPDKDGKPDEILRWFTVDLLLFNKWRRDPALTGFDNYRDFSRYNLLYVGVATKGDSYQRLIERAHEKRLAILSNEKQIKPDARLTDEVVLFFFDSNPLTIRTFALSPDEDFSLIGTDPPFSHHQANIDAEKAFTFFLKANYNRILYQEFPKSNDGLYGSGLDRYMHLIDEDLEFVTESDSFRGAFGINLRGPQIGDAIFVEKDHAEIMKFDQQA
jgi:hypothetical protein